MGGTAGRGSHGPTAAAGVAHRPARQRRRSARRTPRRDFARRGVTLSQADCLAAAAAVAVGARLATGNPKNFPMPEVVLEHWPVSG